MCSFMSKPCVHLQNDSFLTVKENTDMHFVVCIRRENTIKPPLLSMQKEQLLVASLYAKGHFEQY